MTISLKLLAPLSLGALLAFSLAARAAGPVYVFTATCNGKKIVEQWTVDGPDPGREALRTQTQQKHPDCAIGDYKAATDNGALKNTQFWPLEAPMSDGGMPVVGPMIGGAKKSVCGLLGC